MADCDYLILGAGAAGCVMANRLSASPRNDVLLVEAGGRDRNMMFRVPMLGSSAFGNDKYSWSFPTEPANPASKSEPYWPRGKVLGGSTAINGMVYNRGDREDYDDLERLGNKGWGWDDMLPIYLGFEDVEFGPTATRGAGGPLHVSHTRDAEQLSEDIIAAGGKLGWQTVEDYNEVDGERIGHALATIKKGFRVSAAGAFLTPALKRPNLKLAINTEAQRLIFENGRAVGVVVVDENGTTSELRARREVIMCLGAMNSPKLLQLSGVGPREVLERAGVPIYLERANVGEKMLEHFGLFNTYELNEDIGFNRYFRTKAGKAKTLLKYLATRKGPLATATGDVMGLFKTDPSLDRVDGQVLVRLVSVKNMHATDAGIDDVGGVSCAGEVLRSTSEGRTWITSANPDDPAVVDPNYMATEYDRKTAVAVIRRIRELFEQSPLAEHIKAEKVPGPDVTSEDDMIAILLKNGATGSHAVNTCGMGPGDEDVVDDRCRVRGIEGLRIVDCSSMPTMISGNLMGPMMAMAGRASELILDEK